MIKTSERLVRYPTTSNALRSLLDGPRNEAPPKGSRLTARLLPQHPADLEPANKPRQLILKTPPQPARPAPHADLMRVPVGELDDVAALGRMIRLRRLALNLTQQQLADRAHVGRRFISEVEAGKPTVELGRVLAVCRALGLILLAAT